ncbi:MAG: PilZ domain-containing protein [Candidatus Omnitrophica bacterium]|nr:PilZ domain-containing protein [Candidatus Omnitrophota bacterium]
MMPDANASGPRRHPRSYETILIRYRRIDPQNDLGDFAENECVASTVNFSASGMLIRTSEKFTVKTLLDIRFKLRPDGHEIHQLAQVVRYEPAPFSGLHYAGLLFTSLSDADKAEIERFVRSSEPGRGSV